MRRRLFVYGTLRDPELRAAFLGRRGISLRTTLAVLRGYRLLCSRREDCPVLHRSPHARAQGELLEPLSAADLRRLGRYEGSEYHLGVVRVKGPGRRWLSAVAYLPRHAQAGGRVWEYESWRERRSAASKELLRWRAQASNPKRRNEPRQSA